MPVFYKLHKIIRSFKDGREDRANNRWYARAINVGTIDTDKLAERISYSTTVTPSDCVAVLKALGKVMNEVLGESHSVKLENIGTFSIGIKSKGAESVAEFSVNGNIKGMHVNFQPEFTVDRTTGRRVVPMTQGIKVKETSFNDVEKE